ncbi:unnamed protein product [Dibothriocephalus latus]|uniref:Rho-GAP domain-containing protein n=1 Tax=Dibothriocephalus latus TaxID=60516 RepID=A0A3P6SQM9_DIBLA|nr:unnamed protein product [Dibothriocephalus latus]
MCLFFLSLFLFFLLLFWVLDCSDTFTRTMEPRHSTAFRFLATLKDFFRELPEPLFTNTLYPMVYEATQVAGPGDSHMGTKLILNILDCLPTSNQGTKILHKIVSLTAKMVSDLAVCFQEVLLYLLDHLKRITSKSMVNKMNSHNLAVCLAPVLLHPSPEAAKDMEPSLIESRKMVSILECILDIWP